MAKVQGLNKRIEAMEERKKKFFVAFKKNEGYIARTCDTIGITRQTYYRWCEDDEKFKEKIVDYNESVIDKAESKLQSHIDNDNIACLIFYLKTKARARGYVERYETEQIGEQRLKVDFTGMTLEQIRAELNED